MTAAAVSAWCEAVRKVLDDKRRTDTARFNMYVGLGVPEDEATRRVYYPWKTLQQYHDMLADYEAAFGAKAETKSGKKK